MTRRLEWSLGLIATALLVILHGVFFLSAGALWRDEVNSVSLASMPTLYEVSANLQYDSFPIAWFAVLRAWIGAGIGATDLGLRALGLLVGLGTIGVLWGNARRLGYSIPLFGLALLGFNSSVICYGDSVRGYGLGMLAGLLAFGLIWAVAKEPTLRRVVLATASALLAVHCLFYNAVFLLAACAGGVAVTLRRAEWRRAGLIVGIGLVAALSLLPYAGTIRQAGDWNPIVRYEIGAGWIWWKFREALETSGALAPWLWIGFTVLGIAAGFLAQRRGELSSAERDAALFCATALAVGSVAYLIFLKTLSYLMQPWYFLVLMALVAACLDGAFAWLRHRTAGAIARPLVVGAVMALALLPVFRSVRVRKTNLDVVASEIQAGAREQDVVVVSPWYHGVTFERYYRGRVPWLTVPPISFHAFHRYDLLKLQMMSTDPMRALLDRMRDALEAGGRVWWVGDLHTPPRGEAPPELPPAPHPMWGWSDVPYYHAWTLQAGHFLDRHALRSQAIPLPLRQAVSDYENPPLYRIEGWDE